MGSAKKVRAKRIRRETKAADKPVERKVVVEPDEIDEYDEKTVRALAANTPEVRFRHSKYFTNDEDKIIAASLKSRVQLYKVAATLKCCFNTLRKHIENSPVLAEIAKEAKEIECGEIREAVDDLVKMRHPQVVMWRAKQLMPQEYGDAVETEEDDTRIVIGAIPDDLIAEADRKLELAAAKPPDAGLSAMLDPRAKAEVEKKVAEAKDKGHAKQDQPEESPETEADGEVVDVGEDADAFLDEGGFDGDFGGDFGGGGDLGF